MIKYRKRNLGRRDSTLNKRSIYVELYNRRALFPRSRVVLTPGQYLKLGLRPVCSGRVGAFQRSSDRRGCSCSSCSSASVSPPPLARAGLFMVNCTHLLRLEHVWPSRLWYAHTFIQVVPDYRWKTLNPGRPFIGLGLLLAAFHYDKAVSPCPPRLAWRKWTRLHALHLGVVCICNQHLNRKNRWARQACLNPLSGCVYRSRPYA